MCPLVLVADLIQCLDLMLGSFNCVVLHKLVLICVVLVVFY
jgi:hypothetical protein